MGTTESPDNQPESLPHAPPEWQRKGEEPEDLLKVTEQERAERAAAVAAADQHNDR